MAGVRELAAQGAHRPGRGTIVCVLTGHGLKDPATASAQATATLAAPPTIDGVMEVLGW